MGRYETSRELLNYGVSSGYDITMEAAVCKMMYLLEKYRDANEIKKYLNSSIKGEITMNHIGFLYLAASFGASCGNTKVCKGTPEV